MAISKENVLTWIRDFAHVVAENRDMLTELDSAIGDADHGANMDRGFKAVINKLPANEDKDIGTILKGVGMTLLSTVGGAGGPLYSTVFMQAGKEIGATEEFGLAEWSVALEAAAAGIARLGKALPNDKTMLDALYPAIESLKTAVAENTPLPEALRKSADAAHAGMLATIPMLAHKGRASYLGERSIGHQDPGATSTFLLLDTAAKAWADSD